MAVNEASGPFTLVRRVVDAAEFVERWAVLYDYKLEDQYDLNIGQPLTRERVLALFEWKNGGRFSRRKEASVLRNYVDRIGELEGLDRATPADAFLRRFDTGGAIWRIYWLHLWAPTKYPIYDQHVHRAMALIETGRPEEIPASDPAKIKSYLVRYLPFYSQFRDLDLRRVDKALWSCGKRMKALTGAPID
jgi:hypothetical protein